MPRMWVYILFLLYGESAYAFAQALPHLKYALHGYVKYESMFDSRQNVGFADNQIILFPAGPLFDSQGHDSNAHGQYNMFAIETRFLLTVQGPRIANAKPTAVVGADFFGRNSITNIFSMRHAYLTLASPGLQLLVGYNWHPLCFEDYFPHALSNNNGDPFACDGRTSQIRVTYTHGTTDFMCAAMTQIDFVNDGPIGFDSRYLRNALIPNLDLQIRHRFANHAFCCGIDFKRIVPRLVTNKQIKAHESLYSAGASALIALRWPTFSFTSNVTVGQNMTNFILIGGYAAHTIDPITDARTYTNIGVVSWWTDLEFMRWKERCMPGLFIGCTKNCGARNTIIPDLLSSDGTVIERRVFGIGTDIDTVARISPRLRFFYKQVTAGIELECTRACYGRLNDRADVTNTRPVTNARILMAVYYNF